MTRREACSSPNRAAASYAVVISGGIAGTQFINNNNDDSSAGSPPVEPYGFYPLAHRRFNGPFNQNSRLRLTDILDGTTSTAGIGERYRYCNLNACERN